MATFSEFPPDSGLLDVLQTFPKNSERLLRLLDDIMCGDGELTRGQREAIARRISQANDVPYCVFYHTLFSEVFAGPIDATDDHIAPLLDYAVSLNDGDRAKIEQAFETSLAAGWSEAAIYEVVEVTGIFGFINAIVTAAGLETPKEAPTPTPTAGDLAASYRTMADAVKSPV